MREICRGLQFPEGPIAMADGSVVLVEIKRGTLTRVTSSGEVDVIAHCGGGPNGAALGPDGAVYVCNNGGFSWSERNGWTLPGVQPDDYRGGSIQRVDLSTGVVSTLYRECDGRQLRGPNDIVFDRHGGFYFTDLGKGRDVDIDRGAIYYALPDGSSITTVAFPLDRPNGIGLSPEEDRLYYAETPTGRLWYWELDGPGQLRPVGQGPLFSSATQPAHHLATMDGEARLDSLAIDSEGNVCVATLITGAVTAIAPDGSLRARYPVPEHDPMVTNVCFGGPELKTAFVTSSGFGRLYAVDWFCAGHPLNFLNEGANA